MKIQTLTDITHWSHMALAEVLKPGDLAVDLTVGSGLDTTFLWEAVGPDGCVVGFDIQIEALKKAEALLTDQGAEVKLYRENFRSVQQTSGIHLFLADHARWPEFVNGSPKGIIANLGYLPDSDQRIVTQASTTVAALSAALKRLPSGGRLAVVCYVDHPGGREEAEAVKELFGRETDGSFRVLGINNFLYEKGPFLMVAEKRRKNRDS